MINIPIWVFVILITLSAILALIVGTTIVSYGIYCSYKNRETTKEIEKKYGTRKEN